MREELTHEQICEFLEDSLKNCLAALSHIYIQRANGKVKRNALTPKETLVLKKANLLTNVNWYGAYLHGAKAMLSALDAHGYLGTQKADENLINRAQIKAFTKDARALEWLLEGLPEGVELRTELKRNKKGKIIGAEAKFVEKKITYTEI